MSAEDRYNSLKRALEDQKSFSERKATLSHYISMGITVVSLGCMVTAAVLGLFSLAQDKIVGGIAGLPAVIASVALALKLDTKSNWHYRKGVRTRALLRRLCFQGPDPMTIEYVSSISEEFNRLDETMAEERTEAQTPNPPARSEQK